MSFSYLSYHLLPSDPGVYIFLDKIGEVLYVGKANNLKKRVSSYFTKNATLGPKTSLLVSQIQTIKHIRVESEVESLLLEAKLIKNYNPKFNSRLTDSKSYPYIRVEAWKKIPKVLQSRNDLDKKSIYFGPFPSAGAMRTVLKIARRIFPFQSVVNHPKKYCLYYHLGLCPCPPMFKTNQELSSYKKNIRRLISFLNGRTQNILKELEKERNVVSKNLKYEDAHKIQKKIDAIKLVTSAVNAPYEYEENINLREDLRLQEIDELRKALNDNAYELSKLERIECFDISNISGSFATGSMVVFKNGEKDPSSYRRFKIKFPPKVVPNDFEMIKEVLLRRILNTNWPRPNLVIIDGGKGQVSSAISVMERLSWNTPIIGLAKREEIIITRKFKEVRLPKSSPALKLVMRIRDEAHRFAVTYHKKLRSKAMFS